MNTLETKKQELKEISKKIDDLEEQSRKIKSDLDAEKVKEAFKLGLFDDVKLKMSTYYSYNGTVTDKLAKFFSADYHQHFDLAEDITISFSDWDMCIWFKNIRRQELGEPSIIIPKIKETMAKYDIPFSCIEQSLLKQRNDLKGKSDRITKEYNDYCEILSKVL